jgi:hypothetical protein
MQSRAQCDSAQNVMPMQSGMQCKEECKEECNAKRNAMQSGMQCGMQSGTQSGMQSGMQFNAIQYKAECNAAQRRAKGNAN